MLTLRRVRTGSEELIPGERLAMRTADNPPPGEALGPRWISSPGRLFEQSSWWAPAPLPASTVGCLLNSVGRAGGVGE
jgi:hypothetical protein